MATMECEAVEGRGLMTSLWVVFLRQRENSSDKWGPWKPVNPNNPTVFLERPIDEEYGNDRCERKAVEFRKILDS
jgi:hypothetical protein